MFFYRLKFKYEQLGESIKKFDVKLKKEKVSKLMSEILNDSKTSQVNRVQKKVSSNKISFIFCFKLKYVSRANITSLIQNVKEEVNQIQTLCQDETDDSSGKASHRINSSAKQDEFTVLMKEFNNFNESINTIMTTMPDADSSTENTKKQGRNF